MLTKAISVAAMLISTLVLPEFAHAQETIRVTLVGTGTPTARPDQLGPATLVEVADQKLLFDAGRGVPIRLGQLRIPMAKIDVLFITHYHSDHVSGIPDLWLTGWLPAGGQRKQPFRVIGPTGAKELMSNLERAYAADVRIRIADQKLPAEGVAIRTRSLPPTASSTKEPAFALLRLKWTTARRTNPLTDIGLITKINPC